MSISMHGNTDFITTQTITSIMRQNSHSLQCWWYSGLQGTGLQNLHPHSQQHYRHHHITMCLYLYLILAVHS